MGYEGKDYLSGMSSAPNVRAEGGPINTYSPKILVIEDNARYAIELARALKQPHGDFQFDVDIVSSALEAAPYIERNDVDIYIVDLKIPELEDDSKTRAAIGRNLVRQIVEKTNAGTIIHSNIPLGIDAERLLDLGADDYLEKGKSPKYVRAKAFAVWRRVKAARSEKTNLLRHSNRSFRIGKWVFSIGNRELKTNCSEKVKLSPTECAFIQYLCTVDSEIDRREFNVAILGRPAYEEDQRIDNLVYRLREKLGDSFQLISKRGGTYKLLELEEIKSSK